MLMLLVVPDDSWEVGRLATAGALRIERKFCAKKRL